MAIVLQNATDGDHMVERMLGGGAGMTPTGQGHGQGDGAGEGIGQVFHAAPTISRWSNRQLFSLTVPVFDVVAVVGAAYFAHLVQPLVAVLDATPTRPEEAVALGLFGALLFVTAMNARRLFRFNELATPSRSATGVNVIWILCLVLMMAAGYLFGVTERFPRSLTLPWAGASAVALTGVHLVAAAGIQWCRRNGLFRQRIAVVGATPRVMEMLVGVLQGQIGTDYEVVGIFDDRMSRVPPKVAGIPVVGTVPDLLSHCRRQLLDVIVIAIPWAAESRNAQIIKQLRELPVDITLAPDLDTTLMPPRGILWLGGLPTVLVSRRPLSDQQQGIKWLEDKAVALAALLCLSPIMLLAALAVKLTSKGPLFFTQERFGFNQQTIKVLKFRSMYVDRQDVSGQARTVKDDPRVTPVGRFIRRYSIDELPQLFNVLRGDMSVVGPRAHAVKMAVGGRYYYEAVQEYAARHKVKPGITGWAQVNGSRGEVQTQEQAERRLELDVFYVDNWSLFLDFKIMFMTAKQVFFDKQAY